MSRDRRPVLIFGWRVSYDNTNVSYLAKQFSTMLRSTTELRVNKKPPTFVEGKLGTLISQRGVMEFRTFEVVVSSYS